MLYCNYFRYFEDQIPDRIFLKVVLSARIFHVATRLENVRQELEARSRIRMEKKRGKNLQEKNLRNIQNSPSSLSFHFFFYLLFIFASPRKIENFSIVETFLFNFIPPPKIR